MDSTAVLLAGFAGVAGIALIVAGLPVRAWAARVRLRVRGKRILHERLARRAELQPVQAVQRAEEVRAKPRQNLLPRLTALLSRTRIQPLLVQLEQALTLARVPLKPAEFLYVSAVALLIALLAVQLTTDNLILALLITFVAGMAPFYYLRFVQRLRFQRIDYQVADALLLMTSTLRSGASFLDAMDAVAREMPPPISDEFARTLRDVSFGVPVEEALTRMCARCQSEDIELAVTAFRIQREVGGNLSVILDNIAETIRERVKLKQEVRTLSAQGRLSGAILCGLPVVILVGLQAMSPEYTRLLLGSPEGVRMLVVAIVLQLVGIVAIARITKIEA